MTISDKALRRTSAALAWGLFPVLLWLYFHSPLGQVSAWTYLQRLAPSLLEDPTLDVLLLCRYLLQNLALTISMIAADLVVGFALVSAIFRTAGTGLPPVLRAATSLAIGCGASSVGMFFLGQLHLLTARATEGLMIASALGACAYLKSQNRLKWVTAFLTIFRPPRRPRPAAAIAVIIALPTLLLLVLDMATPVIGFDSTTYHLSAAKQYWQSNTLDFFDNLRFNAFPQMPQLLYLRHWMILGDDSVLKLVNVEHYCPVKSRIESVGEGHRVSFRGSRTAARSAKWAFSRTG